MNHRSRIVGIRARLTAALAATALLLGVVVVSAATPAAAYPTSSVNLIGHGWGHGRGMGQYGALGYSLNGWSYTQILDHYYGGTTMGSIAGGVMSTRLLRLDGTFTIVAQEKGLGRINGTPTSAVGMMAQLVAPNTFQVYTGGGCGGPWTALGGPVTGPVVFSSPNSGSDHTTMLQTCESAGNRWYRGDLVAADGTGGACSGAGACQPQQRTVNRADIDSYVRGVVPSESPASWGTLGGGAGENALRAQAVAARSYGWAQNRYSYAKSCDTDSCQVYNGYAINNSSGFHVYEAATTDQATADTAGQVRVFSNGSVASTEFSSSTGGYTAGGTFPAVVDDGDSVSSNPNHSWSTSIAVSTIQAAYPAIGTLLSVDVTGRNGLGDLGGRVTQVVLRGSSSNVTLTGEQFRSRFALKSDWFAVTNSPSGGIDGYWVVAPDGGIFSFGAARFFGSMGGKPLNQPVVGMAATGSGNGYWQVATDGGMFSFGDARFFGSMGGRPLNKPIVGMAATPTGNGYWLVASDGGIFSFGDAGFLGSTGCMRLSLPLVGMASTPSGSGYWLLGADGGLFAFDAPYAGSLPGSRVVDTAVAMRPSATGGGYDIVANSGRMYAFGDAPFLGDVATAVPGYRGGVRGMDVHKG
jgi:SpoIID/LytB domain protein